MPLTVSNTTGDGVTSTLIDLDIELPDAPGTLLIAGSVTPVGQAAVAVTGGPLAIPAAPASGSVFYNVQVNTSTGVASVQQSTTADPAVQANSIVAFRQTLAPTSTDPALVPESTPDTA